MQVSFPTDKDGYISQECPSCERRFKVKFGEGSKEPLSCCPYCGHKGQSCWYTKEQVAYIEAIAVEDIIGPELKKLADSSGGFLKIDMKGDLPQAGSPPMETDDTLDILHFPCCSETVKLTRQAAHFCIICGKEIDMTTSDAKKVFLSHKGTDKADVIDYKHTLTLLGYSPWFDEDAMPAGTTLERGLLQGMQDSCGVVFFITPSFQDEGYLASEVDYAIQQKRQKGDKFAIITLQFVGTDGAVGKIPELLKTYVWKKPKTALEALREIVRALPVETGAVDWRTGISDIVLAPKMRTTSTELSEEAKAILTAAASGDGQILSLRHMGGCVIQTSGKQLIPDQNPRTVARWLGGLEDLQRRRLVSAIGHKGEVFEVTREGYEIADLLSKA